MSFVLVPLALAPVLFLHSAFLPMPSSVEMGAMSAVAVDAHDRIFVLHRGPKPLLAFDKDGRFLHAFGEGLFKVAHGLRIDRAGNIWTTDNGNHLIRKFSPEGKLLDTLDLGLKSPDDLVFASNGEIYVADAGNGRIVRLSADGKTVLGTWGRRGKADGEFALAHSLAIDSRDRLYVADRGNNRIQVFDRDGKFLRAFSGFGNPFGVFVYRGELLVTDGDANRLIQLDLETGGQLAAWGDSKSLQLPHLMASDSHGRLFVSEVNGKRVQVFHAGVR